MRSSPQAEPALSCVVIRLSSWRHKKPTAANQEAFVELTMLVLQGI
jgi:hypothetical protein